MKMEKRLDVSEIRLDADPTRMLAGRLAGELRRLIARDDLGGAVLPSARSLAEQLKVNRQTVCTAYAELEKQNVIRRRSPKIFEACRDFYRNDMEPFPNIGIILPCRFSDLVSGPGGFCLPYIRGIIDAAAERKIAVLMLALPGFSASAREIEQFNASLNRRLIGVVHLGARGHTPDRPLEALLKNEKLPQVMIASYPRAANVGAVIFDTHSGARALAERLLSMNHRKVGLILPFPGFEPDESDPLLSYACERRPQEVRDVLKEYGLDCDDRYCCFSCSYYNATLSALKKKMESGTLPSAFWCYNDEIALWCLKALRELGLSVPDDISVVGFDGIDSDNEAGELTTICLPFYAGGRRAVQQLLEYREHGINESNRFSHLQTFLISKRTLARNRRNTEQ